METKYCTKCNQTKSIDAFRGNPRATIQGYCVTCRRYKEKICKSCGLNKPMTAYQKPRSPTCNECVNHRANIEKYCYICKKTKSSDEFNASIASVDGKQRHCRVCSSIMSPIWEKGRDIEWRRKRDRSYYEAKPKLVFSDERQYLFSNIVSNNNAKAKRKNIIGKLTTADWRVVVDLADAKCMACGVDFDLVNPKNEKSLTLDHVVPIVKGGYNQIENTQPLCLRCNIRKGGNTIDYRTKEFIAAVYENCTIGRVAQTRG